MTRAAAAQESLLSLLLGIVEGMEHIHAKNIIHGDLKPENVLLTADPSSPMLMVAKITGGGWGGLGGSSGGVCAPCVVKWLRLMPHASCLMPHASCLTPHASCLMPGPLTWSHGPCGRCMPPVPPSLNFW